MQLLTGFGTKGKVSAILGGQFASESKGSACAWVAATLAKEGQSFDIVTVNNGAQSGHISIHNGKRRTLFHMPTAPYIAEDELGKGRGGTVYLNAGSIVDPTSFEKELNDNPYEGPLFIHPMAAVITDDCKAAEMVATSGTTKIASTRKGVGEALARKIMRTGQMAKDHPFLKKFVRNVDLNNHLRVGATVLMEIPQGVSLSLNHSNFYPYCTSRDCTPMQAMADAAILPTFYNGSMVVLRTRPIRVGHIVEGGNVVGESGPCYADQRELSWEELGVEPEITTVTKRVRRVFTFSQQQVVDTFALTNPDLVFLTFCNYVKDPAELNGIVQAIHNASKMLYQPPPRIIFQWGPTTDDVGEEYKTARAA